MFLNLLFQIIVLLPMRDIPPPQYQGDGRAVVAFVSDQEAMNIFCKNKSLDFDTLGCVYKGDEKTPDLMLISNPCNYPDDMYARHVCHELGHVNGWPGDHPDRQVYKLPRTSQQTSPKK